MFAYNHTSFIYTWALAATGSPWKQIHFVFFCNHVGNICFTHSAPWWWVAERVTRVVMVDQWPNICKSGTRKYGLMPNPPHLQILHLIVNLNDSNFSFLGSCPIFLFFFQPIIEFFYCVHPIVQFLTYDETSDPLLSRCQLVEYAADAQSHWNTELFIRPLPSPSNLKYVFHALIVFLTGKDMNASM